MSISFKGNEILVNPAEEKSEKSNESGQGLVEYALILALIVIVCIAVLGLLGRNVNSALSRVNSAVVSGSSTN